MESVYLDYQASTPIDPRVVEGMLPYFTEHFGNPSSIEHVHGNNAAKAVRQARRQVASAINASVREIVFTSGATESNNLAILGVANKTCKSKNRFVSVQTEHSSVLGPLSNLRESGFEVELLPIESSGRLRLDLLEQALDDRVALVSVMYVNNETGVIQPIDEIASIVRSKSDALFHSDCAQALGRIAVDVTALDVDLATFSSHKAYGPKGIGALYCRERCLDRIAPITFGGGQEKSLRPGTLPVALCVGFGIAARLVEQELAQDMRRVRQLSERLISGLKCAWADSKILGTSRIPGSMNVQFPGYTVDELIGAFDGISVSSGSACSSAVLEPSPVLLAHGLSPEQANSSIRIGIGRFTTDEEIQQTIRTLLRGAQQLKQ